MNISPSHPFLPTATSERLADTARAFDSVAVSYDGISGNNALVQIMRAELWRAVMQRVPRDGHLLDLGCGTGLDAEYFARQGYFVTATDASSEMLNQTDARITRDGLTEQAHIQAVGAHELERLQETEFDAIYSDLGALNCVPDLASVAQQCRVHLKSKRLLVFSVIGRFCPWEIAFYSLRGNFQEARRRLTHEMVSVNLNHQTVWTRYYSPSEFFQFFSQDFKLVNYRALNLFLPPPYLLRWYERARFLMTPLQWLDAHLDTLPLLRNMGDHFLMVMQRKD